MNILLSCQFSTYLRDGFRAQGHNAWTNDIIPCEGDQTYHILGDAIEQAYSGNWDMMIAMPPCTYLTLSGVRWLFDERPKYENRWSAMVDGAAFYDKLLNAPIPKICVENPVMHSYAHSRINWRGEMQYVHPYYFSGTTSKKTGLRLVNLPRLVHKQVIPHEQITYEIHNEPPGPERQKNRSRTFPGIADGMLEWGLL